MDDKQRKKVIKMVRESIISAAKEAEVVKGKTASIAKKMSERWEATKPLQKRAAQNVRSTADEVVAFSKSVAQGVKEGIREVRKGSPKRE